MKHLCPMDPNSECDWSNGTDCIATMEQAKDCELNSLEDAAACEEAAL